MTRTELTKALQQHTGSVVITVGEQVEVLI